MHTDFDSSETSTYALSASSPSIVPHCGDIPTTFFGAHKIIRLLNKRGFRSGGDGWSCAGSDGARVKSRCRKVECLGGKGRSPSNTRNKRGEIFTDYYFGEANTPNKSENHHNNAINKNLNWGGFPGCYSSLPPTVDLVPRSRTIPGGRGERRRRTQHHQQRTRLHVERRTSVETIPQRDNNVERRGHRDFKSRTDNSNRQSNRSIITQSVRILGNRT